MEIRTLKWVLESLSPLEVRPLILDPESRPLTPDSGGTKEAPSLPLNISEIRVKGVCTDTRKLKAGDLFFALIGEKSDGRQFVSKALANGATAAVVSQFMPDVEGIQILVPDTLLALGKLAKAYRLEFDIPLVAITGSVGKTSTKEMLAAALRSQGNVLASEKNFNNEIGVPMTLLQLSLEHEFAIIEMGMRGPGQIAYLAEMVSPTIGAITNIGHSHIELLGSQQGIAEAKAELLPFIQPGGEAVLPLGEFTDYLISQTPKGIGTSLFGEETSEYSNYVKVTSSSNEATFDSNGRPAFTINSDIRSRREFAVKKDRAEVKLSASGGHHVQNALCVAAIMSRLGYELSEYKLGLEGWMGAEGRMSVKHSANGMTVLDDCYNAGPESMTAALGALSARTQGRRVAVLGDMKELGDHWQDLHRLVGQAVVAAKVTLLITVGGLAAEIAKTAVQNSANSGESQIQVVSYPDSESAAREISDLVFSSDTVLVKGSRAMQMEKIVAALTGEESSDAHA